MRKSLFVFSVLSALSFSRAEDLPLVFSDDFSKGFSEWNPTDAKAWKITEIDGNKVYENLGGSKYEPPYRSPKNISLRKDKVVGDFVLTAKVQTTKEAYGHRDMCLFFGYQDPSNFYYIHLGEKKDPHANQIFLVNESPRIAISEKASEGTPWDDGTWHDVKVVRDVESGLIEVYFDDMETPTHVAHDKTFTWGQVGLGTFDDKGMWDDVELRGVEVEAPGTAQADPKQLEFEKWTPDFQVPDPVAIAFDPKGRAYVTQTQRRKANDLDIRPNSDWISNDLSFQSPDDKIAFYKEQFTPENSAANAARVEDYTGDGIHDIRDLTALTERIHLIADTDGDGLADEMHTYAEDLDHLIGGVAGGVLYFDGDVYTCPVPELVRFRDKDGDDRADEKEVLVSGFGVHIAYAGHDMHGLFVGPDGRIYWSVGDKGIRVKTADGLDYRFPNQGGLMRCEPDGSNFEVFAHGQRNIQEIAFDQYGNFFGVDNDADFEGERERFVHIEQYMDSGWRANWQYLREEYNPWNDELMHVPWHEGQARWFTPPLSNYENGPAGFKMNPGTALSPAYSDYFFLTSAPRGEQWAFQIKSSGDSFKMVNDHKIGEGVPLVGLNFGPDGALYGVDWGGGYPLNEQGAVWRIDVAEESRNSERRMTNAHLVADLDAVENESVRQFLRHADQRVRLKGQFELVKREAVPDLVKTAQAPMENQLARVHAIWGLGQLRRQGLLEGSVFMELCSDPDPEIRAQAIRTVTDGFGKRLGFDRVSAPVGESSLTEALVENLADPSQRVRLQALIGLGRLGDPSATDAILDLLGRKENEIGMTYLRHAGVMAMTGAVPTEKLKSLADHKSDFVRACAVVALRKRGEEAVTAFLSDPDPVTASDAACAIHDDWMIPEAMPALAKMFGTHTGSQPFTRRVINANFRLGKTKNAERVAAFVAEGNAPEGILKAGLEALRNWTEPGDLDLVIGRYRPLEPRDPSVVREALVPHLDAMLTSNFSSVRTTAMELARSSEIAIANETLVAVLENKKAKNGLRAEALRSLSSQKAPGLAEVVDRFENDRADEVRVAALDALSKLDSEKAASLMKQRIEGDASVRVKQHAIASLAIVKASDEMKKLVDQLVSGKLDPALQLDVLTTAKESAFSKNPAIVEPVTKLESEWQTAMATDMLAPFRVALAGGDSKAGRSVFMNHAAAQCIRCHKVADGSGSNVGPNLKEIGKKKEPLYILESLIDTQKVVAQGYGNISLTLDDGSSVAGQFREERDGHVILRDAENNETKIPVDEIAARSPVVSTMPPMGFILTKHELRDVMAYLTSLGK